MRLTAGTLGQYLAESFGAIAMVQELRELAEGCPRFYVSINYNDGCGWHKEEMQQVDHRLYFRKEHSPHWGEDNCFGVWAMIEDDPTLDDWADMKAEELDVFSTGFIIIEHDVITKHTHITDYEYTTRI